MIIYVLAGDYERRHGNNRIEGPLTDEAKVIVKSIAISIVKKYGAVKYIYTSPYCNARETAQILMQYTSRISDEHVELRYVADLGRKIPNRKNKVVISEETLSHIPPICETCEEWECRVDKTHENNRKVLSYDDRCDTTKIYVTHCDFVSRITGKPYNELMYARYYTFNTIICNEPCYKPPRCHVCANIQCQCNKQFSIKLNCMLPEDQILCNMACPPPPNCNKCCNGIPIPCQQNQCGQHQPCHHVCCCQQNNPV